MTRDVLCDRCGERLQSLEGAVLAIASDSLGRAIGLTLDHAGCAEERRDALRDDESLTALPASELRADRLRTVARAHWASASRILAKVKRLANGRSTDVRTLRPIQPDGAPDVRPRPLLEDLP